jgi:hypothetical protein
MGMLFNTDNTLQVLSLLNGRYNDKNIDNVRTDVQILRDYRTYKSIHSVAKALGLTNNKVDANWKQWLDAVDAHDQGAAKGGVVIREAIAGFLEEADCSAIEFFAVPSNQLQILFPPKVPDPKGPNKYSRIITVETLTYDKVAAFVRAQRKRNAGKAKKKSGS